MQNRSAHAINGPIAAAVAPPADTGIEKRADDLRGSFPRLSAPGAFLPELAREELERGPRLCLLIRIQVDAAGREERSRLGRYLERL